MIGWGRSRPLLWMAALLLCLVWAPGTQAAGMSTHALMADLGREGLEDGVLKSVLSRHRRALLAGAIHPDGGYGSQLVFPEDGEMAERAHWEDFNNAFMVHLRAIGCAQEIATALADSRMGAETRIDAIGFRCGRLVAFAFGNAAHGITDETWDSLFEPVVRQRDFGEQKALVLRKAAHRHGPSCRHLFQPPADPEALRRAMSTQDGRALQDLLAFGPVPGIEYAMDMVAIVDHGLWRNLPLLQFPPAEDIAAVHAINRPELGVTRAQVQRAFLVSKAAVTAEAVGAPVESLRMRSLLPWAAANYYMGSGGVIDSARAVTGLYGQLWAKLLDAPESPRIVAVHPEPEEIDVPFAHDDARARIRAFTGQSAAAAEIEQPGVICLFDESGARVEGSIRSGIYDPDWGHVIAFRPAADLKPDHRYTVVITDRWVDQLGQAPRDAKSWRFRTAARMP
ncbi:Ig-like domain-containing protein [Algiphilus sp. NNCM1]|nr:Ig-like domain-containing protein [Algiphilus acroporae]